MTSIRRALLAFVTAALIPFAGATAQDARPDAQGAGWDANITGTWSLRTKAFFDLCRITGDMTLARGAGPDEYVGELFAHQRCGNGYIGYIEWRAEQTVAAVRDGDRLSIKSTIVRVTPPSNTYAPDDFELTIVSGSLMMGELRSFLGDSLTPMGVVDAAFERGDGAIA